MLSEQMNEHNFPFLFAQQIEKQLNMFFEGYHRECPPVEKFQHIPSARDEHFCTREEGEPKDL